MYIRIGGDFYQIPGNFLPKMVGWHRAPFPACLAGPLMFYAVFGKKHYAFCVHSLTVSAILKHADRINRI